MTSPVRRLPPQNLRLDFRGFQVEGDSAGIQSLLMCGVEALRSLGAVGISPVQTHSTDPQLQQLQQLQTQVEQLTQLLQLQQLQQAQTTLAPPASPEPRELALSGSEEVETLKLLLREVLEAKQLPPTIHPYNCEQFQAGCHTQPQHQPNWATKTHGTAETEETVDVEAAEAIATLQAVPTELCPPQLNRKRLIERLIHWLVLAGFTAAAAVGLSTYFRYSQIEPTTQEKRTDTPAATPAPAPPAKAPHNNALPRELPPPPKCSGPGCGQP